MSVFKSSECLHVDVCMNVFLHVRTHEEENEAERQKEIEARRWQEDRRTPSETHRDQKGVSLPLNQISSLSKAVSPPQTEAPWGRTVPFCSDQGSLRS